MENTNNVFEISAGNSVPVNAYVNRHGSRYVHILNINGDEHNVSDIKEVLDAVRELPRLIFSPAVTALVELKVVEIDDTGFVLRSKNFDKLDERINNVLG